MFSATSSKTPLYDYHIAAGARMVDFSGWLLPMQYESILSEYWACRQKAVVFDICHMGEFFIEGNPKQNGLDRLVTCSISDMPLKTGRYGFLLNEKAGIIDDFIIFRLADEEYLMVVNAVNIEKDFFFLKKNMLIPEQIHDRSMILGKLDLQGPLARDILIEDIPGIVDLKYYNCEKYQTYLGDIIISRTGYTGELGYEIFLPLKKIKILWEKLLKNDNLQPAGLGARDILRIEMGYSLYGQDLSEEITPLDAGLLNFVDLSKDFIGCSELDRKCSKDPQKQTIYFVSATRRTPRPGQRIFMSNDQDIGQVSSGAFSPHLERGIGIAIVSWQKVKDDDEIFFGDNKKKDLAVVCRKPFYKKGSLKI